MKKVYLVLNIYKCEKNISINKQICANTERTKHIRIKVVSEESIAQVEKIRLLKTIHFLFPVYWNLFPKW